MKPNAVLLASLVVLVLLEVSSGFKEGEFKVIPQLKDKPIDRISVQAGSSP